MSSTSENGSTAEPTTLISEVGHPSFRDGHNCDGNRGAFSAMPGSGGEAELDEAAPQLEPPQVEYKKFLDVSEPFLTENKAASGFVNASAEVQLALLLEAHEKVLDINKRLLEKEATTNSSASASSDAEAENAILREEMKGIFGMNMRVYKEMQNLMANYKVLQEKYQLAWDEREKRHLEEKETASATPKTARRASVAAGPKEAEPKTRALEKGFWLYFEDEVAKAKKKILPIALHKFTTKIMERFRATGRLSELFNEEELDEAFAVLNANVMKTQLGADVGELDM